MEITRGGGWPSTISRVICDSSDEERSVYRKYVVLSGCLDAWQILPRRFNTRNRERDDYIREIARFMKKMEQSYSPFISTEEEYLPNFQQKKINKSWKFFFNKESPLPFFFSYSPFFNLRETHTPENSEKYMKNDETIVC